MPWRRDRLPTRVFLGFPGGSAGKESACNAGDLGPIRGLGRTPGEGKGYQLQYSGLENSMECIAHGAAESQIRLRKGASLVAQLVKNLPAMQKILVQILGWEDPLEKGYATHSSILGLPLWLSW